MSKFVTISKWGNCLGVRIPAHIIDNLNLQAGDQAELSYQGNRIMLEIEVRERPAKLKTPAEEFEEQIRRQLHEAGIPGY